MFRLTKAIATIPRMRKAYSYTMPALLQCRGVAETSSPSYLSDMPYCDFSEVFDQERHWKIEKDSYLSLLNDSAEFSVDIQLNSFSEGVYMSMKLPDDDGYATFVLRLQGFMIGSAGVYDDYDADDVSILVSKRGIFCEESPEIRFLSPAGMKTLLSVDADIRRSIQELNCLNRREALEFITTPSSDPYEAVTRYDESGSYEDFAGIQDEWDAESYDEELIERFGFTEEEIEASSSLNR